MQGIPARRALVIAVLYCGTPERYGDILAALESRLRRYPHLVRKEHGTRSTRADDSMPIARLWGHLPTYE